MPPNITPWIVIALAVVAALAYKGHIRLPFRRTDDETEPLTPPPIERATTAPATLNVDQLDSRTLGFYLAKAARREAEEEIAGRAAMETVEQIKATFKAPFSPPEATQPPPNGGE